MSRLANIPVRNHLRPEPPDRLHNPFAPFLAKAISRHINCFVSTTLMEHRDACLNAAGIQLRIIIKVSVDKLVLSPKCLSLLICCMADRLNLRHSARIHICINLYFLMYCTIVECAICIQLVVNITSKDEVRYGF